MNARTRIDAHFVAAGKYHDIDFARLEVLKLLAEHDEVRTTVACDYSNIERVSSDEIARRRLEFDQAQVLAAAPLADARIRMETEAALYRSVQMAGALERLLAYSLQYAGDRVQFGRPIGKFQAVQHRLAPGVTNSAMKYSGKLGWDVLLQIKGPMLTEI